MCPSVGICGRENKKFDHCDVWSFGISLLEIALGKIPFEHQDTNLDLNAYETIFSKIDSVLYQKQFSGEFKSFVKNCLKKDRKSPMELLNEDFIKIHKNSSMNLKQWLKEKNTIICQ